MSVSPKAALSEMFMQKSIFLSAQITKSGHKREMRLIPANLDGVDSRHLAKLLLLLLWRQCGH